MLIACRASTALLFPCPSALFPDCLVLALLFPVPLPRLLIVWF